MPIKLPFPDVSFPPGKEPTPADLVELSRKLQANLAHLAKETKSA